MWLIVWDLVAKSWHNVTMVSLPFSHHVKVLQLRFNPALTSYKTKFPRCTKNQIPRVFQTLQLVDSTPKNFDGYHVQQFLSSEEIKFWKVLRCCLWNISASRNKISFQNEFINSCCPSKRKLLTENDDFS